MAKTACCIGINYRGSAEPLQGCENDAHLWANLLERAGFQPQLLLETDATRDAIMGTIGRALTDAGAGGLCAISYAGHGSYRRDNDGDEPDGYDELWCPYDVSGGAVISDDELHQLLSQFPDRRTVLINDSCFGGSIARVALANSVRPRVATARNRFLPPSLIPNSAGWRNSARGNGGLPGPTTVVSGCKDHEWTYEDVFEDLWTGESRVHGAFTHIASSCLRFVGAGASYERWLAEIRPGYLPSVPFPQSPGVTGDIGRVVFT